jgi:thymidylate kinase
VLESYLAIAEREPRRVIKIDAKDRIPKVQEKIIAVTREKLGLK